LAPSWWIRFSASRYPDLLFVAVARGRPAKDDGGDTLLVDAHAFNPVGGNRALNQGMLPQRPQRLGRLSGKKLLLAARLTEIGQVPGGCRWNGLDSRRELPEGHHRRLPPAGSFRGPCSSTRPKAPVGSMWCATWIPTFCTFLFDLHQPIPVHYHQPIGFPWFCSASHFSSGAK
jgi:hypothetical protein